MGIVERLRSDGEDERQRLLDQAWQGLPENVRAKVIADHQGPQSDLIAALRRDQAIIGKELAGTGVQP